MRKLHLLRAGRVVTKFSTMPQHLQPVDGGATGCQSEKFEAPVLLRRPGSDVLRYKAVLKIVTRRCVSNAFSDQSLQPVKIWSKLICSNPILRSSVVHIYQYSVSKLTLETRPWKSPSEPVLGSLGGVPTLEPYFKVLERRGVSNDCIGESCRVRDGRES